MILSARIQAFQQLGQLLENLTPAELQNLYDQSVRENAWFTYPNISMALKAIGQSLSPEQLIPWTSAYTLEPRSVKNVGVAMAGNIPLVGFHDFLCVLIAGHRIVIKPSSQDAASLRYISEQLIGIESGFKDLISFEDRLNGVDAVIATGSNNTARYFEYYFRNIPHIIRKNRSSCAILSGQESSDEMTALGTDIFSYFGLGCRNVSKLFVPSGFNFEPVISAWEKFRRIFDHSKYAHNYNYQKTILQMNRVPVFDNGFVLLREDEALVSPISILNYEFFQNNADLQQRIQKQQDKIQCIASAKGWFPASIPFGKAQFPEVSDYADNVDTLKFLQEL
jgi:hypothetical protein